MKKSNYLESRNSKNEKLILDSYNYENTEVPIVVNNVNYWVDGEDPAIIPSDYFTNPASMFDFQMAKIKWHEQHIDDNYVPVLHPWFGTTVVPSALGCKVVYPKNGDPSLMGSVLSDPSQVKYLKKPDPYKDGLLPTVLRQIDFMKNHTDIPVCVTDTQGPLNIALSIAGVESLFCWFYTNPDEAHALMEFSTDILIDWVKVQKEHAKLPLEGGAFPHGIILPEGKGGVSISDDDCTQLSADIYKEFIVPYNAKVLKAFGGGTIHFCGSAEHQLQNIAETEGLTGVNNFCMGNFNQIYKLQELLAPKKIPIMICDFSPLNATEYYGDLFSKLNKTGVIIGSFPVYSVALDNGKYVQIERDPLLQSIEIFKSLKTLSM